jgi:hypothetical protein
MQLQPEPPHTPSAGPPQLMMQPAAHTASSQGVSHTWLLHSWLPLQSLASQHSKLHAQMLPCLW